VHPTVPPDAPATQAEIGDESYLLPDQPGLHIVATDLGGVIITEDCFGREAIVRICAQYLPTVIDILRQCASTAKQPYDSPVANDERSQDLTGAERQRRYRERQRNAARDAHRDGDAVTAERNGDHQQTALEGNAQPGNG
jgi:hypothetical protein